MPKLSVALEELLNTDIKEWYFIEFSKRQGSDIYSKERVHDVILYLPRIEILTQGVFGVKLGMSADIFSISVRSENQMFYLSNNYGMHYCLLSENKMSELKDLYGNHDKIKF